MLKRRSSLVDRAANILFDRDYIETSPGGNFLCGCSNRKNEEDRQTFDSFLMHVPSI